MRVLLTLLYLLVGRENKGQEAGLGTKEGPILPSIDEKGFKATKKKGGKPFDKPFAEKTGSLAVVGRSVS